MSVCPGEFQEFQRLTTKLPLFRSCFNPIPPVIASANPFLPDGVPDGDNDTDGDGIINRIELEQGTNPFDGLE